MEDLDADKLEHLSALVYGVVGAPGAPCSMPAPVTCRLLLRCMLPAFTPADQLNTADSDGVLVALGSIASLAGGCAGEFPAAVDLARITPPAPLLAAAAALHLARGIAAAVRQEGAAPEVGRVQEVLEGLLQDSQLEAILPDTDLRDRAAEVVAELGACAGGGLAPGDVEAVAARVEALFDAAALQADLEAYANAAWQELGPTYLQAHAREVLSGGEQPPAPGHATYGKPADVFIPEPSPPPPGDEAPGADGGAGPAPASDGAPLPFGGGAPEVLDGIAAAAAPPPPPAEALSPVRAGRNRRQQGAKAGGEPAEAAAAPAAAAAEGRAAEGGGQREPVVNDGRAAAPVAAAPGKRRRQQSKAAKPDPRTAAAAAQKPLAPLRRAAEEGGAGGGAEEGGAGEGGLGEAEPVGEAEIKQEPGLDAVEGLEDAGGAAPTAAAGVEEEDAAAVQEEDGQQRRAAAVDAAGDLSDLEGGPKGPPPQPPRARKGPKRRRRRQQPEEQREEEEEQQEQEEGQQRRQEVQQQQQDEEGEEDGHDKENTATAGGSPPASRGGSRGHAAAAVPPQHGGDGGSAGARRGAITGAGGGARGREMRWDSPSPAPQRAPAGPAVVALPGGNTVAINTSPALKRRKVCRWTPDETDALVNLTYAHGPGNWRTILDAAGDRLRSRTQARCGWRVDLKDKWRNLENAGKVLRDRREQREAARANGYLPAQPAAPGAGRSKGRGGRRSGGGCSGVEVEEGIEDSDDDWDDGP